MLAHVGVMSMEQGRSAKMRELIIAELGPAAKVAISPAETAGAFNSCRAVIEAAQQLYRADALPELPLPDCTHPERCICVYSVQIRDV
jgi:hypothetical protein